MAAKGIDDTGDGGGLALADEVKVKHALDGSCLQAAAREGQCLVGMMQLVRCRGCLLDETSRLVVEEGVRLEGAQRAADGGKAFDVIIGREAGLRGEGAIQAVHTIGSGGAVGLRGHCEVV